MKDLKTEMNSAREKLFKYSILSLLILALPAIAFSLIQIIEYGFDINYVLFCSMFILISVIFLLRNKLSIILKSHIVGSLFLISGFVGNLFFGFSGGHFLCLIGIAIITVLYGKKLGIIYSIIALLGYIVIEYSILNKLFVREIDFNAFNANFISWIYALFTIFITAIILISSISYINKAFIKLVKELDKNNIELNTLNSAYKDVFVKVEESEHKYKSIFQTLNEGVILTDKEGNIIDCNRATEDILGASKEDLLSVNLHSKNFSFIYPDLSPVPDDECPGIKTLEKGVSISNFEVGLQQENQIKWIGLSSEPLKVEGYGVFLTLQDLTHEKEQEQEYLLFNRYFETFLEHITDYVLFKNEDGKIVFCSQSLATLTGYNSWKDIIGKSYGDLVPEDRAKEYQEEDDNVFKTGEQLKGKINLFCDVNGETRQEQTNKIPLFDDNRKVIGIISISRDITEILKEKDIIREKEEKINLILNSTAEGIYGLDNNGNCTFVNQACLNILGYSKEEELLGQNMHNLIHHSDIEGKPIKTQDCTIENAFKNGKGMHSSDEVFWKKDGSKIPVELFSHPQIHKEEVIGAVLTFIDITERKEKEEKISLLLNSTAEGIYGIDNNGNCTFANKACLNILGYSKEEDLLGQNIHNLIHHSDIDGNPMNIHDCIIYKAFTNNIGMHSADEVFWRKDGSYFPAEYFSYPQIHQGEAIGAVVTFFDITERKEKEEKIIAFTKDLQKINFDKDKFIGILAHDLKNPFTSIIGFSQYILDNLEEIDKENIKEFTGIINESSEKGYKLMEEILVWLRVRSGMMDVDKQELELKPVVLHTFKNLKTHAQVKNITLSCLIPDNLYIEADINILKTILRNLVSNSIKFTNKNGEIKVESKEKDNKIQITISDNGVGMNQEYANQLFISDSNETKEGTQGEKGTGLGISIVKELIQKHEELIWVESELGKGSDFIFTMPKAEHKN